MSKKIALSPMIDLPSKEAIQFHIGPLAWVFLKANKRGNSALDVSRAYNAVVELTDSVVWWVIEKSEEGVFPRDLEPEFISTHMKLTEMLSLLANLDWSKVTLNEAVDVLDDLVVYNPSDTTSKRSSELCKPALPILVNWFEANRTMWVEHQRKATEEAAKKQKDRQRKDDREAVARLQAAGYTVTAPAGAQTPNVDGAKPKKEKKSKKK